MSDNDPTQDPEISALVAQAKTATYTVAPADVGDPLWDPGAFAQMWRVAQMFASSRLTPEHLRGKPTDVFLALTIARRARLDPLVVLQSIYFVGGKPGWAAVYLIARAKQAGMPIRWDVQRGKGKVQSRWPEVSVTAYMVLDGERVEATITSADAVAKDWTKNKQYDTSMELMLQYRTATQLVRLYAPDILLGLPVVEELEVVAEPAPPELARAHKALRRELPGLPAEAAADIEDEPEPEPVTAPAESESGDDWDLP